MRVLLLTVIAVAAPAAIPVPIGGLIQHPAHFFDLQHGSLRFRAGQPVQARPQQALFPRGELAKFGPLDMPFDFPFAGRRWKQVHVNPTGSLSFGAPDGTGTPPATWPDGTMRSRAARAELDALEGRCFLIAPLWNLYAQNSAKLWLRRGSREVVVTWEVERFTSVFEGYSSLGRNVFQVRLRANGEVEFRYGAVAEKDGLVGLFSGLPRRETQLAAQTFDAGSLLHFIAPENARIIVDTRGAATGLQQEEIFGAIIEGSEGKATDPMLPALRTLGHFYLSKLSLVTPDRFQREDGTEVRLSEPREFGVDLSAGRARFDGSTFEVFHYPHLWKSRHAAFRAIARHRTDAFDFGIAFLDFRIDDLHNHGSSNTDGARQLTGPVSLGPRFAETAVTPERTYKNHAFGVGWIAHEMIHFWGISAQFQPAIAGQDYHWLPLFEAKVVTPVAHLFADPPYREASLMGGMSVHPTADGRFQGANSEGAASGLSALDLWLMGLLEPGEVPAGHEESRLVTQSNDFAVIRFRDVVAANQPLQKPARGLRQAIYVLHENGRPVRPEALAQAESLERSVLRYYGAATQGRMTVTPVQ